MSEYDTYSFSLESCYNKQWGKRQLQDCKTNVCWKCYKIKSRWKILYSTKKNAKRQLSHQTYFIILCTGQYNFFNKHRQGEERLSNRYKFLKEKQQRKDVISQFPTLHTEKLSRRCASQWIILLNIAKRFTNCQMNMLWLSFSWRLTTLLVSIKDIPQTINFLCQGR